MVKYADIATFITSGLSTAGYTDMPRVAHGPDSEAVLQKLSPEAMVFVITGSGPGLTTEQLFDQVMIHIRTIGRQGDFDGAEKLAYVVDDLMLAVASNTKIGGANALYINRAGGAPLLLDRDAADRTHFTCDYVTEAER